MGMDLTKNYYGILGIDKNISDQEIKSAYRELSKIHHPDKGGDENRFKAISDAYYILSNKQQRELYDIKSIYGSKHKANNSWFGSGYGYTNTNKTYEEFDINDIFSNINRDFYSHINNDANFNTKNNTHTHSNSNNFRYNNFEDLNIIKNVDVTLEQIYQNTKLQIDYTRNIKCTCCNGLGLEMSSESIDCITCSGYGYTQRFGMNIKCEICMGAGVIHSKRCSMCFGNKNIPKKDYIILDSLHTITKQIEINKPGFGNFSKHNPNISGDLIINIIPKSDPRYIIEGRDIIFTLYLDFKTAILGGTYSYQHLDGKTYNINIPSKSNTGSRFKLDKMGLLYNDKLTRGDLILETVLKIDYKNLESEDIEFLKKVNI